MAVAIVLLEFNDIGRSVTPYFSNQNRFYLQLFLYCPKMNKNKCGKLKNLSRFLSTGVCHLAAARRVKLWLLNANLFFEEPHQLTLKDTCLF